MITFVSVGVLFAVLIFAAGWWLGAQNGVS